MNIKELKEKIKDLPDLMDIMIEQTNDESRYNMADEVVVENIKFVDPDNYNVYAYDDCLIIRD